MVVHVDVAIGDHRAPTIPVALAHNMHTRDIERVGCAHDGADVQIVLPVLHRHM